MSTKLCQIIAVEKGIKTRVNAARDALYKSVQKPDLFSGFAKTYEPLEETAEIYPPESKKVQLTADSTLNDLRAQYTELLDITARKDYTNQRASADITINDMVILEDVPVTYLLFLEKQVTDIRTFISKVPVLDQVEEWMVDGTNKELHRTGTLKTHRTKKITRPVVLYDATTEHPAQTAMINEDVLAGYWNLTKHSGAMPANRQKLLLARAERLLDAIKQARELANSEVEVNGVPDAGERVFNYLLQIGE